MRKNELLVPASSLEVLKIAVIYGADAVYIGGEAGVGDREANSMTITGEHNTDILLDEKGQPVPDENGDFKILSDDECWRQDIMLETVTAEGELFYEDATGNERYGFGLTDFIHAEKNDFLEMEIGRLC